MASLVELFDCCVLNALAWCAASPCAVELLALCAVIPVVAADAVLAVEVLLVLLELPRSVDNVELIVTNCSRLFTATS